VLLSPGMPRSQLARELHFAECRMTRNDRNAEISANQIQLASCLPIERAKLQPSQERRGYPYGPAILAGDRILWAVQ
jgi:hypothetical protein